MWIGGGSRQPVLAETRVPERCGFYPKAGATGGWVDSVLMRVIDGLLAFPLLVLALAVVAALGPGLRNALIAIAVIVTPRISRVVRGEVLSLRTREWVSAARIVGVPQRIILFRHLLPHLAGSLLVFTALQLRLFRGGDGS